ncbi:unnamed protein product [Arabidopsis halleri]
MISQKLSKALQLTKETSLRQDTFVTVGDVDLCIRDWHGRNTLSKSLQKL